MASEPIERYPFTDAEFEQYQREGYVVVEGLLSDETVDGLKRRLREYTHGDREVPEGVHMQIEPRVERGEMEVAEEGDAVRNFEWLAPADDRFTDLALHDDVVARAGHVLGAHLQLYRSGVMLKPPEVGSEKGVHQDAPYWPFQPPEQLSVWIPLDDATPENGCMQVIPGAHLRGELPHVDVTDDYVVDPDCYDEDDLVAVPMDAGSALFFNAMLPHYTSPNTSDRWRRAAVLVYLSARTRFDEDGRPEFHPDEYLDVSGRTFPGCVD